MKRRDLLRRLGGVGAVTAVGRLLDPAAAGGQSLPATSGRSTTDNLASRLAASIQKHKVPGASAAVFRAGQWEVAAAGVTNVTTGVGVSAETVMHIGSITKVLNATLVMQLVDEGRVELTASLKRYLPDFQVADRDATELITVDPSGTTASNVNAAGLGGSYAPVISADGRYVAYYSYSTNLVNGITYNPNTDNLFLRDRMNGTTSLISIGTDGISAANGPTNQPTMSADGSKIAFTSQASNLVAGITYAQNPFPGISFPTNPNVFLWDRMTNTTIVVSKAAIGNDTGGGASPAISPDGSTIAFLSTGTNLTVGNNYLTNPFTNSPVLNLFVYDVPGKTVSLLSGAEGSNDAANADVYPGSPATSADGAQIAFASYATNIVKANYPGTGAVTPQNVFLADSAANTMTLVTGGNASYFYAPVISQSGQYVASSNGNVLLAYPDWPSSGSTPPGTPPGTVPMGGGGGGGGGGCASVTVTQKGDYGLLMLLLAAFGYRYWSGRKLRPRQIPTA